MGAYIKATVALFLCFALSGCVMNTTPLENPPEKPEQVKEVEVYAKTPAVNIGGTLYLDTGFRNKHTLDIPEPYGEITSSVPAGELPTKDGQSNFGSGYGYIYGETEGTVEIFIEGSRLIFATEEVRKELQFPNTEKDKPNASFDTLTAIHSGAVFALPYEHLIFSEEWTERGWLCADGTYLPSIIPRVSSELMPVYINDGYEILYGDGVKLMSVSVYGADCNEILNNVPIEELLSLKSGVYYLAVNVKKDGNYIASENKKEVSGYACLYKLIVESEEGVPSFSYEDAVNELKASSPGVKTEGFKNTTESKISSPEDAVDHAENECTIDHTSAKAHYDEEARVWMVLFYTENTLGGCQSVYMGADGITKLIVYGE